MIHPTEENIPLDEPITQQPLILKDNLLSPSARHKTRLGSGGRMAKPEAKKGIEESLKGVTHLFIKQTVISAEFFVNALNKYEILNSSGERVFLAAETTDFLTRFCYGGFQPFKLSIYNARPTRSLVPKKGNKSKSFLEVLNLNGSPGMCTSVGHVTVTDGIKPLGSVQQLQKYGSPLYSVRNTMEVEILQVRGPDIGHCCFGVRPLISSLEFEIIDPKDETMVGRILKQWGGYARELFTKADIWGIKFPPDMDTSTKALLLATVFLIDFQYFER